MQQNLLFAPDVQQVSKVLSNTVSVQPVNVRPTMLNVAQTISVAIKQWSIVEQDKGCFVEWGMKSRFFLFSLFHIEPLRKGRQPNPFFLRKPPSTEYWDWSVATGTGPGMKSMLSNFSSRIFVLQILQPRFHAALLLCALQFCLLQGLFDLLWGLLEGHLLKVLQQIDILATFFGPSEPKSGFSSCLWASFLLLQRVTSSWSAVVSFSFLNSEIFTDAPSAGPPEL